TPFQLRGTCSPASRLLRGGHFGIHFLIIVGGNVEELSSFRRLIVSKPHAGIGSVRMAGFFVEKACALGIAIHLGQESAIVQYERIVGIQLVGLLKKLPRIIQRITVEGGNSTQIQSPHLSGQALFPLHAIAYSFRSLSSHLGHWLAAPVLI